MINFNAESYLKAGEKIYGQREAIEKMADEIHEKGYDNIILLGIGGTWAESHTVAHVLKKYTDFPIYLENAAEFCIKEKRNFLTERSLVITSSDSGNTKEVLAGVDLCREAGATIAGFTRSKDNALGQKLDYIGFSNEGDDEDAYLLYFFFALRLLYNRGEFPAYPRFAEQMGCLYENLLRIREEFEPEAERMAKAYAKEPYTMFVGSGALWGETYMFSMCILEEMQWIRTRAVTSADFFHGVLELVEKDTPVFLFKGEDEYRALDERVENFCRKITDRLEVIDTAEFRLGGIDDEFRVICSPMILTSLVTDRLGIHYEAVTGHSLDIRRYYKQFDY